MMKQPPCLESCASPPWEFFRRTDFKCHAFYQSQCSACWKSWTCPQWAGPFFTLPTAPGGSSLLIFRTFFFVSTQLLCGAGTWKELVGGEQKDRIPSKGWIPVSSRPTPAHSSHVFPSSSLMQQIGSCSGLSKGSRNEAGGHFLTMLRAACWASQASLPLMGEGFSSLALRIYRDPHTFTLSHLLTGTRAELYHLLLADEETEDLMGSVFFVRRELDVSPSALKVSDFPTRPHLLPFR